MSAVASEVVPLTAERRRGWVLIVLTAFAVTGAVALALVKPSNGDFVSLELAPNAAAFETALTSAWVQDCKPDEGCPQGKQIFRLRSGLLVDSLLFVPGYAGLLVFFTLLLATANEIRGRVVLVQLLCALPVATAFFDIAENGMTVRAADDWLLTLLSDGVVADVRLASLTKWMLSGVSFAVVGTLALLAALPRIVKPAAGEEPVRRTPRPPERWALLVGAAASLLAAAGFELGVGSQSALGPAMLASSVALVALIAWQVMVMRHTSTGRQSR